MFEINKIKEKAEQTIELSQIELKEYEVSIKKFEPKTSIEKKELIGNLSSSEDFSSEKEEKADEKT